VAPRFPGARAQCEAARRVPGACALAERAGLLDQIHESVITLDLGGYITGWNRSAERLFGYTAAEAIGRHVLILYADPAEDDGELGQGVAALEQGGREMEVRRRRKSGEVFWASLQLSLHRDANGEPVGLIGYMADITPRVEAEKNLRLQSSIFEHSAESIVITDAARHIVSVNPAFTRITGYEAAAVTGRTPEFLRSERHPGHFYTELWERVDRDGGWHGEVWTRRSNGEDFPSWASISLVRNRDGQICNYFSIFTDITERKAAEARIHRLAYYDSLTGLPNRELFGKLVEQALSTARRGERRGALLFLDLNRFKPINDSLGHAIGDRLLRRVAERLRHAVRDEDVVARLGGDEFVVALFDTVRRADAARVADKLIAALVPPLEIDGHMLKVGVAIGISVYPDDGDATEMLLRMADIAMYRSKQSGRDGYTFYSHDMNEEALARLNIESDLRRAIESDALQVHYQPKVDITSGRIVGAEALVRWPTGGGDMVSPESFIPVAEESGLIGQLSDWVLAAVLRQTRAWATAGLAPVKVAINLSARDFAPDLAERLERLLAFHAVAPHWIELEITEGMLTHSSTAVIAMMDRLNALGLTLALDDFGTGYSSLAYLKRFPIDTLKIDRSFITGIPDDPNDCAIAGAIIGMAQRMGHRVIAEGVETRAQLDYLRSLGCQEIQGHLFSPPLPASEFVALLGSGRTLSLQ